MSLVSLTELEFQVAILVGTHRCAESRSQGHQDKHGLEQGSAWDVHIEGAAAELAYCKFRGKYWAPTINDFKAPDVGHNVQIRSTHHTNGKLILRDEDPDEHFYVLLTGRAPHFTVRGYIVGRDAKQDQWREAPNGRPPAFFVPQQELNKFEK